MSEKNMILKFAVFSILMSGGIGFFFVIALKKGIARSPVDIPILAFALFALFSMLYAESKIYSLRTMCLISYSVMFYFFMKTVDYDNAKKIIIVWSASCVFISIYSIMQFLGMDPLHWQSSGAVVSFFGNRNRFAHYLTLAFPALVCLFFYFENALTRIIVALSIIITALGLLVTYSRGAWIAVTLSLCFALFLLGRNVLKKNISWILGIILLVAVLALAMIGYRELKDQIGSVLKAEINFSEQSRLYWWQSSLNAMKENLLFGKGIGSFEVLYPVYRTADEKKIAGYTTAEKRAHNDYLQYGMETGLTGLALFLWVCFTFVIYAVNVFRHTDGFRKILTLCSVSAVTATLIHMLVDFNLQNPVAMYLFFGVMAFPFLRNKADESKWNFGNKEIVIGIMVTVSCLLILVNSRQFFAEAYLSDGRKLSAGNDPRSAYEKLNVNTELDKADMEGYTDKINALRKIQLATGDENLTREVLENLKKAREMFPYYFNFIYGLGKMQYETGDLRSAIFNYRTAIRLAPDFPAMNNDLAECYEKTGHQKRAKREYENILEMDDEAMKTSALDKLTRISGPDDDKRIYYLKKGVAVQPDNPRWYFELGNLYSSRDQHELAGHYYTKALDVSPGHIDAMINLGVTLARKGEIEKAKELWARVVILEPGNRTATDYLEKFK